MPLKKRRGGGGFYKKETVEDLQEAKYIVIGRDKKTNKTWEEAKYTDFKSAKRCVDSNTKDNIEYYVYFENNSNRIVYPIG